MRTSRPDEKHTRARPSSTSWVDGPGEETRRRSDGSGQQQPVGETSGLDGRPYQWADEQAAGRAGETCGSGQDVRQDERVAAQAHSSTRFYLMQHTLKDPEHHLFVKVLDDLVHPYVHKILVAVEPPLINEDSSGRMNRQDECADERTTGRVIEHTKGRAYEGTSTRGDEQMTA